MRHSHRKHKLYFDHFPSPDQRTTYWVEVAHPPPTYAYPNELIPSYIIPRVTCMHSFSLSFYWEESCILFLSSDATADTRQS